MAKKQTLEELLAEQEKTERELKIAKQNLRVLEAEEKRLTRNQRTHRLCTHGGLLEKFLPPDEFTEEEIMEIMTAVFRSGEARAILEKYRSKAGQA